MSGWCDACGGTGVLICYCGGDNCICENNGEYECPLCDGDAGDDEEYETWPPEEQGEAG